MNSPRLTEIMENVSSGGDSLDVSIQDQNTPPLASYFVKSVSNFTLSSDSGISTVDTLVYTFEATAGHDILVTNEIILLDTVRNKSFQAVVTNVATNTITVDRPIDHAYPSAITLGRVITSQMAVDGSSTPQIFSIRAGTTPVDVSKFIITMLDSSDMDDGKFGGITALTNGLVLRIVNSYQRTIFSFKTNGEIKQFAEMLEYSSKAPAGQFGLSSQITLNGRDKYGIVLRISNDDVIQWVVQDDLTGLDSLKISAIGQDTEGET